MSGRSRSEACVRDRHMDQCHCNPLLVIAYHILQRVEPYQEMGCGADDFVVDQAPESAYSVGEEG